MPCVLEEDGKYLAHKYNTYKFIVGVNGKLTFKIKHDILKKGV